MPKRMTTKVAEKTVETLKHGANNVMVESNRQHHIDKRFESDIRDSEFSNHLFLRVSAKEKRFTKVDFKYTIFDTCYFRKCVFDTCDFTGCRFKDTSLVGSTFHGCKFDYAAFDKTYVESEILDVCCPPFENLKLRFARSLRTNYQALGDTESAKKALDVELEATESHLHKAWRSNESYYRKKYAGFARFRAFRQWMAFKFWDLMWGNGESILKLLRAVLVIWLLMAANHVIMLGNPIHLPDYLKALLSIPAIAFGVTKPSSYPEFYLALVTLIRFVFLAMFISVLIKRLSRR